MTVLVTDHHEIPYEEKEDGSIERFLPNADAIVNPKQEAAPILLKKSAEQWLHLR